MKMFVSKRLWLFTLIIQLSYSFLEKNDSVRLKDELHCQSWNATIIANGNSLEKLVQATIWPFPDYEKCFTYYFAYLHLMKPKYSECYLEQGVGIKQKKVELHNQEKQNYKVIFTNLEAGYYCILFQPCSRKCYETYLHSNVFEIKESPTATFKQNVMKKETLIKGAEITYICVALLLTIICSTVIYWNYKHRKIRKKSDIGIEKGTNLPFLPNPDGAEQESDCKPGDTEVFFFYYPHEDTRKLIDSFANLLEKCAQFRVTVIDDRLPEIHFEVVPMSYFGALLDCCSLNDGKCICNKRLIIVMTEHLIAYMHSMRKTTEHLTDSSLGDIQAGWFHYGLRRIIMDWEKCFSDFTHFYVINFKDIPYIEQHDVITVAPNVQFSIQHQREVVKLCQELNSSFKDASLLSKLMHCLNEYSKNTKLFNDL